MRTSEWLSNMDSLILPGYFWNAHSIAWLLLNTKEKSFRVGSKNDYQYDTKQKKKKNVEPPVALLHYAR